MFWMFLAGLMSGSSIVAWSFYLFLSKKYSDLFNEYLLALKNIKIAQQDIENLKNILTEEKDRLEADYDFERESG